MANNFIQYLKETRAEMNNVSWPTRMQTFVYTVIIVLTSIFIAVYLGLFDYLFTTGLGKGIDFVSQVKAVQISSSTKK